LGISTHLIATPPATIETEPYRALPAKVAQWVLKQVCAAWDSFFAALSAWKADPSRFQGRPRPPKYLDKQGRNLLTYTLQAISRPQLRSGIIQPSGLAIHVQTQQTAVQQVRIVPRWQADCARLVSGQ
jgi:hypothetical protein